MLGGDDVFGAGSHLISLPSVESLTHANVREAAHARDGVVFALSYILHQRFMQDLGGLITLMQMIRTETAGIPTWLLLQDANYTETFGGKTVIWPETRLNVLANACAPIGYHVRGATAKTIFRSPHVTIDEGGNFVREEAGERSNVCHFFQRIA
jgi:hypothetical protein